jgi:SAM-dependent methyltransferase
MTTTIPPITELPEDRHWWFATRTWSLENLIEANISRRDGNVLDIGCGAGNMIHHLRKYGTVQGIEVDERPVAMAQQRGYDVRLGDATRRIPFADASFDLVTALDVIEHVDADEAILREAYRVLRPNGILTISTPAFMWLWSHNDVLNGHKHRYTPQELRERVERAGFKIKRLTFGFFLVFPLSAPLIVLRNKVGQKQELKSHHLDKDEYQVEMEPTSPLVNTILRGVGRTEATMLKMIDLPIGSSLMCVAVKK